MQNQSLTAPTLLTVRQFAERHKAFSEAGLRYLIFHADTNGMAKCLRRVGRRVLIDESVFFECIEHNSQHA